MASGKFNLTQKGLIVVAIPLVVELVFFGSLFYLLQDTERQRNEAVHARALIGNMNALMVTIYNIGADLIPSTIHSNENGTAEDEDQTFEARKQSIRDQYRAVQALAITPKELSDMAPLGETVERFIGVLDDVHVLLKQVGKDLGSFSQLQKRRKVIVRLLRDLKGQLTGMLEPELELERKSPEKERRAADALKTLVYAGIACNILLALAGWRLFSKHIVRRLETLIDNSQKIAAGEPLPPAVPGRDEITDLDVALHNMAEALSEALAMEKALTDNVSDVICSLDAKNRFVAVNPACLDAWGYSESELLGLNVREIIANDEADRMIRRLTEDRGHNKNFDTRVKLKNGQEADMHWTANWSAKQQNYFCVVHDVSAEKEIERMKKEFVAMVSHDLRTPLNSVLNLLTLMSVDAYGEINETGQQRVSAAEQDVTRLIGLINELLDLEKLESGEVVLDIKPCKVNDLLRQAEHSVYGFAQQNAVGIAREDSSLTVNVDQNRFAQVLINLLSNAIKFSEQGTTVNLRASQNQGFTLFEVADSGAGIPADLQATIFERFKQAEDANKKHKGTGLGLSICKNIVEQHGGTIGVQSKVGAGSTFWIKLPEFTDKSQR